MSSFKPTFVAERTLQFISMIGQCTDDGIPLHALLRTLGLCATVCAPPSEQRKTVLNAMWSSVARLTDPYEYVGCMEAWIQFIAQHFTVSLFADVENSKLFITKIPY